MMYACHFFLNGTPCGQGMLPRKLYGGRDYDTPVSIGFFCPNHGEIWARMQVDGASQWILYHRRCERHEALGPRAFELPGSIWLDWDPDFIQALPQPVLMREVKLHLEHYEHWKLTIEAEQLLA